MSQERVGEPEVPLGILEVDRIDFVRHGARADLALPDAMAKVTQRDVAPEVAVEIEHDRVDACERVEQSREPVVRLDLRRVGVEIETEFGHDPAREPRPVDVRIGDAMRVVVADRTVDLAGQASVGERG